MVLREKRTNRAKCLQTDLGKSKGQQALGDMLKITTIRDMNIKTNKISPMCHRPQLETQTCQVREVKGYVGTETCVPSSFVWTGAAIQTANCQYLGKLRRSHIL